MRLRSITKHIRDQNWFAVALDFFIVVAGILIAFQITNWNAERADQTRAQDYLIRLQSDFENIQVRLIASQGSFDESLDAIRQTRSMIKNRESVLEGETAQFLSLLDNIDAQSVPAWRSATYVEMQSAGVLDLIKTANLNQSLVQYDRTTEIAQKGFELLMVRSAYVNPILTSHIEYETSVASSEGTDALNAVSFEFDRMKQDPAFNAALSELARSQSNNRILQANQLTETENVLKALSEALD